MGDRERIGSNKAAQSEGRALLKELRDTRFEGSDEKLAIGLGRPVEEVAALIEANAPVADDIVIKAREIAEERGVE